MAPTHDVTLAENVLRETESRVWLGLLGPGTGVASNVGEKKEMSIDVRVQSGLLRIMQRMPFPGGSWGEIL